MVGVNHSTYLQVGDGTLKITFIEPETNVWHLSIDASLSRYLKSTLPSTSVRFLPVILFTLL